jgi:hypothetical protein
MKKRLLLPLTAVFLLSASSALAGGAPPLVLEVEPGSDVAPDDVARAVGAELGRPVTVAAAGGQHDGDVLSVRSKDGVISERYVDKKGRVLDRELTAPQDGPARVRTIALLAGNLARDEADEIVGANGDAAQQPSDGRTEIIVHVAPGDHVRTIVEANAATVPPAMAPPAPAPAAAPAPAPTPRAVVLPAAVREAPAADTGTGTAQRTWGWLTLGVGAATAAAGGIYAWRVTYRDDPACPSEIAKPGAAPMCVEANQARQHNVILTDALLGGGALLAATGVVLLLTAPHEPAAPTVGLGVGPGSLHLSGTF